MIFLCWGRPSPQEQKACIDKSCFFNYDSTYKGATATNVSCLKEDQELSKDGFYSIMHTFWLVQVLRLTRRHFGLNWTFVDPKTPIQNGAKFCVCVKEFLPWVVMPLQVYVNKSRRGKKTTASFGFGSGTLQGHVLKHKGEPH